MLNAPTRELITIFTKRYLSVVCFSRWSKSVRHQKCAPPGEITPAILYRSNAKSALLIWWGLMYPYRKTRMEYTNCVAYASQTSDIYLWLFKQFTIFCPNTFLHYLSYIALYPCTVTTCFQDWSSSTLGDRGDRPNNT